MEPDTNQMVEPQNRAERRAMGYTEKRMRKFLVRGGHMSPVPAEQHQGSISSLSSLDPEQSIERLKSQRLDRVSGKPRAWQIERKRRRGN